jgi:hypothetical protein
MSSSLTELDADKWEEFERKVTVLHWRVHLSVRPLMQGDHVPPFDLDDAAFALQKRIAFTTRLLRVLGEEPEGCCRCYTIHWNVF